MIICSIAAERAFFNGTQRYIDRARHLEKPRKSVFGSSQDGGIMLFPNNRANLVLRVEVRFGSGKRLGSHC